MLSDLEKAYAYLQAHNLVDIFMHNCEAASDSYMAKQSDMHSSFIRNAFKWATTLEGQEFWDTHDENILRLDIHLSATDVFQYIQQQQQQQAPQSYEYW